MMSLSTTCQMCGKSYRVKPEMAGRKFRCQGCNAVVAIPDIQSIAEPSVDHLLPTPLPPPHAAIPVPIPSAPPNPVAIEEPQPNPFAALKIKPQCKMELVPADVSTRFTVWLFGISVLMVLSFLACTFISTEWTQICMTLVMFPALTIVMLIVPFQVLRIAYCENPSCRAKCKHVPGYFLYYVFSRWRYTARYGLLLVTQFAVLTAIFLIAKIRAPEVIGSRRHRPTVQEENQRLLDRMVTNSGIVISPQHQTSATSSPMPMDPQYFEEMKAEADRQRKEAQKRIAKVNKDMQQLEKRRQDFRKLTDSPSTTVDPRHQRKSPSSVPSARRFSHEEAEKNSLPVDKATPLKKDQTVLVLWGNSWYQCTVVDVTDIEKPKIHYLGWSDASDEYVTLNRVRVPNSKTVTP